MERCCLMKRFAAMVGWVLLFMVFAPLSTFAEEQTFVERGEALAVRVEGAPWTTQGDALVGQGKGNLLVIGKRLGAGDFRLEAKLAIDHLKGSAASIVINGSHFGLEGQAGEMFTEGDVFGRQNLGPAIVAEGKPFQVVVQRTGSRLQVAIDGKPVVTGAIPAKQVVTISLRPWRSTMRVRRLQGVGAFLPLPQVLPQVEVFRRGVGGYHTYRIPAIVVTKQGTLLAFCEGRKSGGGDAGDIDMLLRRSTDGGKTWSPTRVVWDDGKNTCGNPAPVVDQETGTIWLPMTWNLGSDHERDIMAGKSQQPRQVYLTYSKDDGQTWAVPQRISETTRQPHWRWYATGPGNAIQLTRGQHRGRLLIPANHSDHRDASQHPYRSHVFWSDDHGKSWRLGGVQQDRTNESAVVELADGAVLQAMRSYHGTNRRAMARSGDGGETWGQVYLDAALDTPVCQASMLRYSWSEDATRGGKSRILFASPKGRGRSDLHVWVSYDEGKTWPICKSIYPGSSGYSNLVDLGNNRIGILYEKDGYQTISLVTFDLAWLEGD